jgi:hypothetical protein
MDPKTASISRERFLANDALVAHASGLYSLVNVDAQYSADDRAALEQDAGATSDTIEAVKAGAVTLARLAAARARRHTDNSAVDSYAKKCHCGKTVALSPGPNPDLVDTASRRPHYWCTNPGWTKAIAGLKQFGLEPLHEMLVALRKFSHLKLWAELYAEATARVAAGASPPTEPMPPPGDGAEPEPMPDDSGGEGASRAASSSSDSSSSGSSESDEAESAREDESEGDE